MLEYESLSDCDDPIDIIKVYDNVYDERAIYNNQELSNTRLKISVVSSSLVGSFNDNQWRQCRDGTLLHHCSRATSTTVDGKQTQDFQVVQVTI